MFDSWTGFHFACSSECFEAQLKKDGLSFRDKPNLCGSAEKKCKTSFALR